MPFHLDTDLPRELASLAWLIGDWAGAGVVGYPGMESKNFGQEVSCHHDGRPFLEWRSQAWILDDDGNKTEPLATEVGFWRPVTQASDGTNVEFLLAHPTGHVEMYAGKAEPARVEMRTDGVIRSPEARDYSAAARMYGLVNSNLMWVMDMAADGHPLTSYMSAELKRTD